MKVSVIIVNYNVQYFLEVCLHSVFRALSATSGEVIVVDNQSTDGSLSMIRERFPEVKLIANEINQGFGKANNQGVAIAQGDYLLFLNPDTVLPEDFFEKTLTYMEAHPEAGCLGPKLLDGKGQYAPESKRSFPALSVALYKTTGINKLFSKSPYFNKYYAVHIGEDETAPVDVLMGCCMLLRTQVLDKIKVAFDEDFFMYGEDIDLSYRIQKAGYQNIYFPETSIIHYKGESTKKTTLSYVKIFNEALSLFVKKNYPASKAKVFSFVINAGIVFRAMITLLKNFLSIIKMPLLDMLLLLCVYWIVKEVYLFDIKGYTEIKPLALAITVPVYLSLWLGSMYLNGVYELSYHPLRVIRGMAVGTVLAIAYYGLLQTEFRYSRVIIISTAFIGTILMLLMHRVLYHFKILKYIPYDRISKKTTIIAGVEEYAATAKLMRDTEYPLQLFGRISNGSDKEIDALSNRSHLSETLYQSGIQEVVFGMNDLTYKEVFAMMQQCGAAYEYKIHLDGSKGFVGSNSRHTSGDIYITAPKYNLSHSYHVRNKRLFDWGFSFVLLAGYPMVVFVMKKGSLFQNILAVISGKKTWVGYGKQTHSEKLPLLKKAVIPTYYMMDAVVPNEIIIEKTDTEYALHYNVFYDLRLAIKNFKFLSRKD